MIRVRVSCLANEDQTEPEDKRVNQEMKDRKVIREAMALLEFPVYLGRKAHPVTQEKREGKEEQVNQVL